MSQRAHSRRHEGRAIRKARREQKALDEALLIMALQEMPGIVERWEAFAEALVESFIPIVEEVTKAFNDLAAALMGEDPEPKRSDYALVLPATAYSWEDQRRLFLETTPDRTQKPAPSED
ncbi:hypothetical protein HOT31_gp081 [Microbacterium phage Hendrix]|uniref:Uncharacterized protein n=1 Tax=Microbacterium phage Hendrix TaxID=2182341 RepID=A0A2U8UUK8_9CAUD|nr:hypothetical protein HOT31_gp081 [Microbacterium phage Hendrix]AWN07752.1 hypothetical protein PBI_HENDRIX_81 [Microbacterium phage Hendrix]